MKEAYPWPQMQTSKIYKVTFSRSMNCKVCHFHEPLSLSFTIMHFFLQTPKMDHEKVRTNYKTKSFAAKRVKFYNKHALSPIIHRHVTILSFTSLTCDSHSVLFSQPLTVTHKRLILAFYYF